MGIILKLKKLYNLFKLILLIKLLLKKTIFQSPKYISIFDY